MRAPGPLSVLFLALLLAAASPAKAQSTSFQGSFTFVPERSDNVGEAINQAIARMNVATRQVARSRLRRTNAPPRRLDIAITPAAISIGTDGGRPVIAPASGAPTRWTREDGEVLQVSMAIEGARLRQSFQAEDGRRVNLYSLSPDGRTLTLQVTVSSERLPAPVSYRLVYRREGS